jgi:lysophospholipase L1-like esterase
VRLHPLVANSALALFAFAASVALAEGALRVLGVEPLAELFGGRDVFVRASADPEIGYELVPGASGAAWGTRVRVNGRGFRGPEPRGDAELRRVVVLGDSIAFGNEVPAGAEFPARLAEVLGARDPRFEVLNFALGGYDSLQELAVLERHALAFAPEHVVIAYCLNDAGIVSTNREYIERVSRYRDDFWVRRSRLVQFVLHRLDQRSHAAFLHEMNRPERFRELSAGRIDPIAADERELRALMASAADWHPSDWYRDEARVGRIRFALRRIAELSRAREFEVHIAIFPWLEAPGGAYPHAAVHAIVASEAARVGFAVTDLADPFTAAGLESLRAAPFDRVHPNAEGHALAARLVAERLLSAE